MSAQVKAGADLMQVFEAMGEFISEEDFYEWSLPSLRRIATELRARHPDVPLLVFPRGATYALTALQQAGYDVVTLDTKSNRAKARADLKAAAAAELPPLGRVSAVQGNLDVAILKKGASTPMDVQMFTSMMIAELGPQGLIANLGEGLSGAEDPALVAAFIDAVHDCSEKLIQAEAKKLTSA
jgi:uroporphyrinogen decarboxylase